MLAPARKNLDSASYNRVRSGSLDLFGSRKDGCEYLRELDEGLQADFIGSYLMKDT